MIINEVKAPNPGNKDGRFQGRWEIVCRNWSLEPRVRLPEAAGSPGAALRPVTGFGDFPVERLRRDFPILSERINGKQLVWLDNAATTQKPSCVIGRLDYFYRHENSNVHRGVHALAERATDAFEDARRTVARFLGAASPKEIVFVRGATEAVNLVARTYGKQNIGEGDEILISHLEHHANIVPWQLLCQETGAILKVIPVDDSGQIDLAEYAKLLGPRTKLLSLAHVSNALGTVAPVREMACMARAAGAKVFIDGAQAVSHMPVDVKELGCDFYAFSGHKVFGPTGIGALYVSWETLENLPPYQGGGNMISEVTFEKTIYREPPDRFEAGTANIAGAAGLAAALEYVSAIGMDKIYAYERELTEYATEALRTVPGLTLIGTAERKTSILSFTMKGYPDREIGKALDREGIAVRTGHHCAQPILRRFGLESTVRPSLAFYNTRDEIDRMVRILRRLSKNLLA